MSELKNKIIALDIDWLLLAAASFLLLVGLLTMNSFGESNYFFSRQVMWIFVALTVFFTFSFVDWRFLRRSSTVGIMYLLAVIPLILLPFIAPATKGAHSWFAFGGVKVEPADFMGTVLVIILAKYFSRRHVEIANIRHIIISGLYAIIPCLLVLIQPNFGSAMIIFFIWLGMISVSGVSKKHLLVVFLIGTIAFLGMWAFVLKPYQKARISSFLNPLADVRGAGYNARQSTIAVGSGLLTGKGVGYGTQSRLSFLPEYETDFIFAAFAEEWGFFGVLIIFFLFGVVIWRILANALLGATNFETLFGVGVAVLLMAHFVVHVGMNIGLMPITGLPMPFLSYGGSHLLNEFMCLGILMGMRKYRLAFNRGDIYNEFIGPQ